jgi:hypothetical protein
MCSNGKKTVRVCTTSHGAEFKDSKGLSVFSYSFLDKKTASMTICFYDQTDNNEKREKYDNPQGGKKRYLIVLSMYNFLKVLQ